MMNNDIIAKQGLNEDQAKVVLSNEKELIVPAGAGSGKTKTLVTKIIYLIKNGVSLDNFLVLTFTNKAAREMKDRIKGMLKDEGLDHLVNKIDSANIATFDSFAYNFVKQNASLIGLDSNLELLDSAVLSVIKQSIVSKLVYEIMANKDSKYFKLLQDYTRNTNEQTFISDFISLYERLLNIEKLVNIDFNKLIDRNVLFNNFNLEDDLSKISEVYVDNNIERIDYFNSYLKHLKTNSDFDIEQKKPKNSFKDLDEISKRLVNKVFEPLDELIKGNVGFNDINNYYNVLTNDLNLIKELLLSFDLEFTNFKKTNNKYEFRDIAGFLNKILIENTDTLERLKQKTKYVFVDEYQDTSLVQTDFLDMLIKDNDDIKVLYVGDIKQSIYKFRDAKPETFIAKQKAVPNIPLKINYRSSSNIIKFVNDIFTNILTDESKHDIVYKDSHEMLSGSQKYINDVSAGVYLIEQPSLEGKGNVLEDAFVIGSKIKELIDTGVAKLYSEFAILTRNKTAYNEIANVFKYLNIPLQVQRDYNLKESYLMKLIVNILMLSLNLNKEDEDKYRFSYYSLLRSELYETSDYKLFEMFNAKKVPNIEKDSELYQKLHKVKAAIISKSNYQIVKTVVDEFDIYAKVIKTPKAFEKELQINYLLQIAKPLGELGIYSYEFVNYLETLAYEDGRVEQKIFQDDKENSVKLTNIHQSKGLEYEILFLADLDRKMGFRLNEHFGFEKEGGFFAKVANNKAAKAISKLYRSQITKLEAASQLKEELRLLYTAITRAERMIYILGTPKDDYLSLNSFNDYLYEFGIKDIVKEENVSIINEPLREENYFINLYDEKFYYPKVLDSIGEHKFNFKPEFREEKTASINIKTIIDDQLKSNLLKGTILHESLEYGDLFKRLINKLNINLTNANYYKELPFHLEDNNNQFDGIIDLVIEVDNNIYIIDYKTYDIDPLKYADQLLVYEKYLEKIYPKKIIYKYLYSIVKDELIEIK